MTSESETQPTDPPPEGHCYLRIASTQMPYDATNWKSYSIQIIQAFPQRLLAGLEYSFDGKTWLSAAKLSSRIAYELFISCSARDYEKAQYVASQLRRRRYRVFLADKMQFTRDYKKTLFDAIESSLIVLVLLSEEVYKKPKWVRREIDFAEKKDKTIIPWFVDNTPPLSEFEGIFDSVMRIRAERGKNWKTGIKTLFSYISDALQEAPPAPPSWASKIFESTWRLFQAIARKTKDAILWISIAVLVAVVLYLVLMVLIRPESVLLLIGPGNHAEAYWKNSYAATQTGSYRQTDLGQNYIQDFYHNIVSTNKTDDARKNYLRELYKDSNVSPENVSAILAIGGGVNSTTEKDAKSLTILGSTIEPDLAHIVLNASTPEAGDMATHDPKSYTIVHINRNRILFSWRPDGLRKNYVAFDLVPQHLNHEFEFEREIADKLKRTEDQSGPTVLSRRIVILCGEVPLLAAMITMATDPTGIKYDRFNGGLSFNYRDASTNLGLLFRNSVDYDRMDQKFIGLLSLSNNPRFLKPDFERIEQVRRLLQCVLQALRIDENSRDVILIDFVL